MKLLRQPNRWSCLPVSFCMVLDITYERMIELVGHDGSEIIYKKYEEPICRRSFHIQEMIDVCIFHDYSITQIEKSSTLVNKYGKEYAIDFPLTRLKRYLLDYTGVLVGTGHLGTPHAVAWDGVYIYDPNGTKYPLDHFNIDSFFLVVKNNITEKSILESMSELT